MNVAALHHRPAGAWPRTELLSATALAAAALVAALTYFVSLGSVGIPTNGDENVYIHIARKTAESGHWLPLAADIPQVRNTKPPLLFWQSIMATAGGASFTLWRLRLPSVCYTLATTALLVMLLKRLTGEWRSGALAALLYLGFYSTYRYGRPVLTDAPETFWLTLPAVALIASGGGGGGAGGGGGGAGGGGAGELLKHRLAVPLAFGVALGVAALYKSFALVLPMALVVLGWHLELAGYRLRAAALPALSSISLMSAVALSIFALWPLADPDPAAIWREFIVQQNAGKLGAGGAGPLNWLAAALWGGSSIWSLALAVLLNAGLLAPVLLVLEIEAVQRWRAKLLNPEERLLWLWVLGFFVAFALPSQRSGRYLLPVMPALAALLVLAWKRLHRWVFLVSAALGTALALALGVLALRLVQAAGGDLAFSPGFWAAIGCALCLGASALAVPRLARPLTPLLVIVLLLAQGLGLHSYAAPPGPFSAATRAQLTGAAVYIPCDFIAGEEAHRFLLPGAEVRSYAEIEHPSIEELATRYRYFAVYVPVQSTRAAPCAGCRVLDARYLVRGRSTSAQLGRVPLSTVLDRLFVRELLIESPQAPADRPATGEACATRATLSGASEGPKR